MEAKFRGYLFFFTADARVYSPLRDALLVGRFGDAEYVGFYLPGRETPVTIESMHMHVILAYIV